MFRCMIKLRHCNVQEACASTCEGLKECFMSQVRPAGRTLAPAVNTITNNTKQEATFVNTWLVGALQWKVNFYFFFFFTPSFGVRADEKRRRTSQKPLFTDPSNSCLAGVHHTCLTFSLPQKNFQHLGICASYYEIFTVLNSSKTEKVLLFFFCVRLSEIRFLEDLTNSQWLGVRLGPLLKGLCFIKDLGLGAWTSVLDGPQMLDQYWESSGWPLMDGCLCWWWSLPLMDGCCCWWMIGGSAGWPLLLVGYYCFCWLIAPAEWLMYQMGDNCYCFLMAAATSWLLQVTDAARGLLRFYDCWLMLLSDLLLFMGIWCCWVNVESYCTTKLRIWTKNVFAGNLSALGGLYARCILTASSIKTSAKFDTNRRDYLHYTRL